MNSDINNIQQCTPQNKSSNSKDVDMSSKEFSNKKRSRKAYTKKSKKLEEELQQKNADINSISEQKSIQNKYQMEVQNT